MLEAKSIKKIYHSGNDSIPVLKGVDLQIDKGRFVAIVGPSGAGKSTFLHILGGLDNPSAGKIIFDGEDLYALTDAARSLIRSKKIGFVFQFYHLLSEFTVLENVLMPGLISFHPSSLSRHLKDKARGLLKEIGLSDRAKHFPNQLSGGEKQRVAMARALINCPSLLLCDEPTGNLDSATGEGIIALMKKINQENQMTVVVVTHNAELAKTADAVYHLKDGLLVN